MAIIFDKQKKSQKKLILVFVFLVFFTFIVFWQTFFKKETPRAVPDVSLFLLNRVEIDFLALEKTKELEPFAEIDPFEEVESEGITAGRENPFFPY